LYPQNVFRTTGIRSKVISIVLVVTLLLTVLTMVYIRITLKTALAEQLEQKAVSITRDAASRSVDMILTSNFYTLNRLARDTLENNPDVSYVFFIHGESIIADTFMERFPDGLLEANTLHPGTRFNLVKLETEEGIIRDVVAPVLEADGVVVRVGVLDHNIRATMSEATRQLLVISAITLLFGSFTTYMLTTLIAIKPINILAKSVQAVSQGDLSGQVQVNSHDELSELADAFNTMVQRLSRAHKVRNILLKKIIHTQEEERRRIARELHDETGQSLMTLMIALSQVEEAETMTELKNNSKEFRKLLLYTLENVRLLAWKLSPIPLADLGLKAAVELFIKKYAKNDNWQIEFRSAGFDEVRFSPDFETAIYRVVQEALTNAAKHAGANKVQVEMSCENGEVVIIVRDNGKGFDVEAAKEEGIYKTSLGLASMEERITLTGGKFEIVSGPEIGTTIYIRIPVQESGGADNVW
jgi:signal transduction histidine kinase